MIVRPDNRRASDVGRAAPPRGRGRRALAIAFLAASMPLAGAKAAPDAGPTQPASSQASAATRPAGAGVELPAIPNLQTPQGASSAMNWVLLITVLSVAPAVLVMVTCFTRIIVVLGLLRAALATQQLPPNQILFGLALLMTVVVMSPTYGQVHNDAIAPYLAGKTSQTDALKKGQEHVREFMIRQIDNAGNNEDVYLFLSKEQAQAVRAWRDVPTWSLIPGFVVSELKVAFAMGFKIFLPFLVIDMLVASVLVSMGMLMVPPSLVSLPFKLLLFVLADGWHLVVGTLMNSFG
jgi:flagellar biosynthetic protein FliP